MMAVALAGLSLAVWCYLMVGRGGFWLSRERLSELAPDGMPGPSVWPSVVAIVPARDEAESVAASIGSLLLQDYGGAFRVVLVDDGSQDGTAEAARRQAEALGRADRLDIVRGSDLPAGWTGKLWAMKQGLDCAERQVPIPELVLFSDADISYTPHLLANLVTGTERNGLVLASIMAKLNCQSAAERWLVPAFIFFFQKLYPFDWVSDPRRRTAAAAGGCMLIRREALVAAGGLSAIQTALIDDCAMGALLKARGPVWLGLSQRVQSLRPYPRYRDIRRMIVRSAYAELRYRPDILAGTALGMVVTYFVPPIAALTFNGLAGLFGLVSLGLMVAAYAPTLRSYNLPWWRGFGLPVVALVYMAFTLESAWAHARGRGGLWKGRYQAAPTTPTSRA